MYPSLGPVHLVISTMEMSRSHGIEQRRHYEESTTRKRNPVTWSLFFVLPIQTHYLHRVLSSFSKSPISWTICLFCLEAAGLLSIYWQWQPSLNATKICRLGIPIQRIRVELDKYVQEGRWKYPTVFYFSCLFDKDQLSASVSRYNKYSTSRCVTVENTLMVTTVLVLAIGSLESGIGGPDPL